MSCTPKASTPITFSFPPAAPPCPLPARPSKQGAHFIKMRGNELFKVAVRSLEDVSRQVLRKAGLDAG